MLSFGVIEFFFNVPCPLLFLCLCTPAAGGRVGSHRRAESTSSITTPDIRSGRDPSGMYAEHSGHGSRVTRMVSRGQSLKWQVGI